MSDLTSSPQTAETTPMPIDPRSVCNLMLDEADRSQTPITNLVLQKLLYFVHAIYLIETKRPLVSGYFEAWTYGPVHPGAYKAFKVAGARPITFRAEREDPLTGERQSISNPTEQSIMRLVQRVMSSYGHLDARRLVDIAHAPGAPWQIVVDKARTSMALGARIPDNVIIACFNRHKVSVGPISNLGDPGEDTPLT